MMKIKNIVVSALLISIGILLPMVFHSIPNAGGIFLPMHFPVIICGFICGWHFGLAAGVLTPLLSSVLTGMPAAAFLPGMIFELGVYGLVAGVLFGIVKTKRFTLRIFVSLIPAMFAGRLVSGILNAFVFRAGSYSFQAWLSASFVTAWPGVILQIVIIPAILLTLKRSKLVGTRF